MRVLKIVNSRFFFRYFLNNGVLTRSDGNIKKQKTTQQQHCKQFYLFFFVKIEFASVIELLMERIR